MNIIEHGIGSRDKALFWASLWTLGGALFFSLMNATAKYLALIDHQPGFDSAASVPAIPALEVTFARYAVAAFLMLPLVVAKPSRFRVYAADAKYRYCLTSAPMRGKAAVCIYAKRNYSFGKGISI